MPITTYPLSSGGASTFLQLTDTFASYSGEGGKGVRVNAGATALEPYTISSGGDVSATSNFGTDNLLIRSDGTLKGVQGSGISVNDSDDVSGVNSLVGKSTGLAINSISSGDITIEPHGSGLLNVKGGSGEVNVTTASGNADINITPHGTGKSIIKNAQISNLTANELIATDANKNLESLAVATYPSKTELTYVKGVTSAIQTQLGDKQNILSEGAFVNGDKTKLDGIESLADVTDLTNVLSSLNTIGSIAEGDILYRNDTGWVRLARGTDNQVLTATATTINWENVPGGGSTTTQNILVSEESSGSVDVNDADFTQLRGDENFSLVIFDTTNMVTGKMYYGCITNIRSASAVLTVTIPTGLFSNTVLATFELPALGNAPYQIFKDVLGEVHFVTTFSKEI